MPFQDFNKKINALATFDTEEEIRKIVSENSERLVRYVKLQMMEGLDGDGNKVTIFGRDYYHPETLARKARVGGLGGETRWITNYMLGDFYRFLRLDFVGSNFVIWSDVDYFPEILVRSGEKIMHVSKEHLIEFRNEVIIPELKRRLNQRLNGL